MVFKIVFKPSLAVAGYVVAATGAGVGAAISEIGNAMSGVGSGIRLATDLSNQNYGQATITAFGIASGFGVTRLGKLGGGSEQIEGAVNLFFTPMNFMIGNTKYNKRK